MAKHYRFEVTGSDDLGDLHSFKTNDLKRAEEVAEMMREDLETVELVEPDAT
jgi:hypothetical protein